jgi:hypothetical protein
MGEHGGLQAHVRALQLETRRRQQEGPTLSATWQGGTGHHRRGKKSLQLHSLTPDPREIHQKNPPRDQQKQQNL